MKKVMNLGLIFIALISFNVDASRISYERSLELLLKNINPEGTPAGTVVASPSKSSPDYFYHWVRDAALVMSTIYEAMERETDAVKKARLEGLMFDYVEKVKTHQMASGFWSLGEPKYYVSGAPYLEPWGRPQHDGPALRAVTLIKFANYLIEKGDEKWVLDNLYTPTLPALSPIKMDLEYVAIHYGSQGFDYWEEVTGLHFSTAMAMRKALDSGSKLARRLGDHGAAEYYLDKSVEVSRLVERFWNKDKGYIESTIDQSAGFYKSQIDIAVILGVHHGDNNDGFFAVDDWRVMQTAYRIEESFKNIYSINSRNLGPTLGTAIGRYPEDTYDGYRTDREGNPWFLATFAMAEYYLRLAKKVEKSSRFHAGNYCYYLKLDSCKNLTLASDQTLIEQLVFELKLKADSFLKRAEFHSGKEGRMDEQMSRYNGFMMGAPDLTWSYASHIQALIWK